MTELAEPLPAAPLLEAPPVYVEEAPTTSSRRAGVASAWFRRLGWLIVRLAAIAIAYWLLQAGLQTRDYLWTATPSIRFHFDIQNGYQQGWVVVFGGRKLAKADAAHPLTWPQFLRGYLARYDDVVKEAPDAHYNLDYTPARLLVMSMWVWHVKTTYPKASGLREEYITPLLRLNTGCEIASAALMFLLIRHWLRRQSPPSSSLLRRLVDSRGPSILGHDDIPWILGLIGAGMLWFSPAMLTDAHIWPQWDVWLLPFFLGALWLASCEWWFAAGAAVVIGSMFKGQVLMVTPVLLLWPIFGGRFGAASRFVSGFLFAGSLMVAPWLIGSGWVWVAVIALATAALAMLRRRGGWFNHGIGGWIGALAVVIFIASPWMQQSRMPPMILALPIAVLVLATPWATLLMSRWGAAAWVGFVAAVTILIGSEPFHGTWSWWDVGFEYPTRHFLTLAPGLSSNLAALLGKVYDWNISEHAYTLDLHHAGWKWDLTVKALLSTIYGITMVLCGIAAAVHTRRKDPRALVALTAPWVLMYTLLPQMHTRYLMWGSVISGVGIAVSLDLVFLQLVTIATSLALIFDTILENSGGDGSTYPTIYRVLSRMHPGLGWLVLLLGAIYLYQALVPRRRSRRLVRTVEPAAIPADPASTVVPEAKPA